MARTCWLRGTLGTVMIGVVVLSDWLAGCGGVVGGLGAQDPVNAGVFAPSATPYGKTYGEWTALWWQWVCAIPIGDNPLPDPTGEKAGVGQSGPVWFLCGTTGNPPTAERTVTIPVGKAVLFPIVNCFFAAPVDGTTDDQLRAGSKASIDHVTDLEAVVDGRALQGLANYRFASPMYEYTSPPADQALWGGGYEGDPTGRSPMDTGPCSSR
jgi:hypothetical protein